MVSDEHPGEDGQQQQMDKGSDDQDGEDEQMDDNIESNIESKREQAITDLLKKEDLGLI